MNRYRLAQIALAGVLCFSAISCSKFDDLLDRKPLDQVGPEDYYKSADQMLSFTINCYDFFASPQGNWAAGQARWDDGTDNQAAVAPDRGRFSSDNWKVPESGRFGVENIRNINYFLQDVLPKVESGAVSGNQAQINQALGEAYFFRAFAYYGKLKSYGDFPILTEPLTDSEIIVQEKAKRMPRNEVARFILKDLDKAIELLPESTPGKQRLNKLCAQLFKSRVALYEATFEKYHRGTGRVPGDANWPGKDKEWNKGKAFDQDAEVNYFLDQAMASSKVVADALQLVENSHVFDPTTSPNGWNPYYDMFASVNPSGMSEVLLWKQYSKSVSVTHITSERLFSGSGTGWTRGLVQSFLMRNGLPIYAAGSGYTNDDSTIDKTKANRDERLQLFIYSESNVLDYQAKSKFVCARLLESDAFAKETTGYVQRKFRNYDPTMKAASQVDETATIIFRAAEAYLNYIEASYLRKGSLDADATSYWTKLRMRAGITADINTTISATDMSIEADVNRASYDWAAFSAGKAIDATLYSIRRERRCEFCGEGSRWDDLVRWCAMDQVKGYQVEGCNFWTSIHDLPYFKNDAGASRLVYDDDAKANVSSPNLGNYLRPYQIIKGNNDMYGGYTFYKAHYLVPVSINEMKLCSPTKDKANSHFYQNPGWPLEVGPALE